ncbi:MAG: FeoB-associated Cys-rich membrane protein [Spirochaetia bacterium]|nr:FeoB-associated Cys-rich membrane protein [Spirochaetia bacterium]
MNAADIVILGILIALAAFVITKIIRNKRKGKCCSCNCGCCSANNCKDKKD